VGRKIAVPGFGPSATTGINRGGGWFAFLVWAIAAAFRPRARLVVENLCLRQQLLVLQRRHLQPRLGNADRRFWIIASRWFSSWRGSLLIVKPETVLRWRRRGWHAYWSWRSRRQRGRGGRRSIPAEVSLPSRNAANFSPRRSRPLERHYWLSSLHFAGASLRSWHGSHFLGRAAHESISRESQFNHQAPPPCRTNAAGAASGQAG